jgi:hypothetical protein
MTLDIIALVKIIIILTNPAYITINKNENPKSIGNCTSFKIIAKTSNDKGTPKIYQYINVFVFPDFSPFIS